MCSVDKILVVVVVVVDAVIVLFVAMLCNECGRVEGLRLALKIAAMKYFSNKNEMLYVSIEVLNVRLCSRISYEISQGISNTYNDPLVWNK